MIKSWIISFVAINKARRPSRRSWRWLCDWESKSKEKRRGKGATTVANLAILLNKKLLLHALNDSSSARVFRYKDIVEYIIS